MILVAAEDIEAGSPVYFRDGFVYAMQPPERSNMSLRRKPLPVGQDYVILASNDDRLVRHDTVLDAVNEATRLSKKDPGVGFKVFAQVAEKSEPKPLPVTCSPPADSSEFLSRYEYPGVFKDFKPSSSPYSYIPTAIGPPAYPRYFAKPGLPPWHETLYVRFDAKDRVFAVRRGAESWWTNETKVSYPIEYAERYWKEVTANEVKALAFPSAGL